jgi:gas vesicle protein
MGIKNFFSKLFFTENEDKSLGDKVQEKAEQAGQFAEKVGKDVIDTAKPVLDKLQQNTEQVGKVVLENSKEWTDKAGNFTEDIGKKVMDTTETLWNTMKDNAEDLGRKILNKEEEPIAETPDVFASNQATTTNYDNLFSEGDSTATEQLKKEVPIKEEKPFVPKEDPFKEFDNSHEKSSHLEELKSKGTVGGSFFDKAEAFADGRYDDVKDSYIQEDESASEKKDKFDGKIYGFEDQDGDGDSLIDDAIIDKD